MKKRLYLLGIDALPLWLMQEMCREKGFEGFGRLLNEKLIVEAESVLPPMTGPAWPSIYTGLRPSEHGAFDFFMLQSNYTPDIVFYDSERKKPFWELLADAGRKCLVITPATVVRFPKNKSIDMITGFPLPPKANTAELRALMKKHRFAGELDVGRKLKGAKMEVREGARRLTETTRARIAIAEEMLEKHDYDFVYVCFTETDRLQHFAVGRKDWKDYLLPLYREIDGFVRYLLKRVDSENSTLMLVSDHGVQKINSKFLINAWLIKKGYASLKKNVSEMARSGISREEGDGERLYVVREYLLKTKLRLLYEMIPKQLRYYAIMLGERLLLRRGRNNFFRIYTFDFDMRKTTAFAFMSVDPVCAIWINDKRFASGVVSDEERKELRDGLIHDLEAARDRDGKKLFQHVYDAQKYYATKTKMIFPDVFAEIRQGYTMDSVYFSETEFFMEPGDARNGDHTRKGVFGAYPGRYMPKKREFSILEVAPAVLSYFGIGAGRLGNEGRKRG